MNKVINRIKHIGSSIRLTDKVYLRIGTRVRWYEARESDELDTEVLLPSG